ncbi:hypothetical protein JTB14_006073 [Gonioctena quinquepunctata]|nr:hypothetical protein JTB14_006073 [Gonioctena quinquepunctata]
MLFSVPKDEKELRKWAEVAGKHLPVNGFGCSIHFPNWCLGSKKLLKGALPSLREGIPRQPSNSDPGSSSVGPNRLPCASSPEQVSENNSMSQPLPSAIYATSNPSTLSRYIRSFRALFWHDESRRWMHYSS